MPIYQSGNPLTTLAGISLPTPPVPPQTFTKEIQLHGARLSTAAGSYGDTATAQPMFQADAPCQVVAVNEKHTVLGSTTAMLVIAPGSTPLNSGLPVLASTIDMTSTVDIPNAGTILNSTARTQLAANDTVGLRFTTAGNQPPVGVFEVTFEYI